MIVDLQLDSMTIEEKISTMEILWEDISKGYNNFNSPIWHKEILENREKEISDRTTTFEDWESVKRDIWDSLAW